MNLAYKLSTAKTGGPALASAAQLVLMLTFLLLALPVSAAAQIAQFSYAQREDGRRGEGLAIHRQNFFHQTVS